MAINISCLLYTSVRAILRNARNIFFWDALVKSHKHSALTFFPGNDNITKLTCGCGGIGRRARLSSSGSNTVWVQVPSSAPTKKEPRGSFFVGADEGGERIPFYKGQALAPVSYTHLDVYKRQGRSPGSACPI